MKKFIYMLILFGIITIPLQAQEKAEPAEPKLILTVSFKSYKDTMEQVSKVVDTAAPGLGMQLQMQLPAILGNPAFTGVNTEKPLFVTVGFISKDVPVITGIFLPVSNFDMFKTGLQPTGIFTQTRFGPNHIEKVDNYALIVLNAQKGDFKAIDHAAAVKKWKPGSGASEHLISVTFNPEPLRAIALTALEQVKGMIAGLAAMGAMSGKGAQLDPQAMQKIINIYFSALKAFAEGLDRAELHLDSGAKSIKAKLSLIPKTGTPMAEFVTPPDWNISEISGWLDPNAQIAGAGGWSKDTPLMEKLQEFIPLSLKMQGLDKATAEKLTKDNKEFLELMSPSLYLMTMGFADKGIEFAYAIKLDNERSQKALATMQNMHKNMKAITGPDKMYSKAEYTPNVTTAGGVTVDRFALSFNMNNPQAAGLKQLGMSEMIFNYAVAGDTLVMATPGKFDALYAVVKDNKKINAAPLRTNSVFTGWMNIFSLMQRLMGMIPVMQQNQLEMLRSIDTAGTGIMVEAVCNNTADIYVSVPLKLLTKAGEFFRKVRTQNMQTQPGLVQPVPNI